MKLHMTPKHSRAVRKMDKTINETFDLARLTISQADEAVDRAYGAGKCGTAEALVAFAKAVQAAKATLEVALGKVQG